MAINLANFLKPQWVFRSENAGDWDVYYYSMNAAVVVEKYSSGLISDPIEAVRALIGEICKTHVENKEDDLSLPKKPTEDDLSAFTEEDINDFSRHLLLNDRKINNESDLKKLDGQSDAEFLLEVLKVENKKLTSKMNDMFSGLNNSIGRLLGSKSPGIRNVSEDLLKQNKELENYYSPRPSIFETSPELFIPPPNPIHETNDRLGDMAERMESLVRFGENALRIMSGLQVASAEFLEKFSAEAEKNSKAATKAIWVGALAVFCSIAQVGYTEFWRVPQDTADMKSALASVLGKINELETALGTKLASSQVAEAEFAASVAVLINSTRETNTALLEKIDLLLQQQRMRDEALIETLGEILETARNSDQ